MTFTDPTPAPAQASDDPSTPKPRTRQRSRAPAVTSPIRTRLVPNCAWPTEADTPPAKRSKRR